MMNLYKLSEDRNYLTGLYTIQFHKKRSCDDYRCVYASAILTELQDALDEVPNADPYEKLAFFRETLEGREFLMLVTK